MKIDLFLYYIQAPLEQFEVAPLNLINTSFVNFSATNFFILNIFILLGVTSLMFCNNTLKLDNTFCFFFTRRIPKASCNYMM